MRKPTERLFVTCASSGATSRWAMRVNSSSQLSTSTTSEARLDLTARILALSLALRDKAESVL